MYQRITRISSNSNSNADVYSNESRCFCVTALSYLSCIISWQLIWKRHKNNSSRVQKLLCCLCTDGGSQSHTAVHQVYKDLQTFGVVPSHIRVLLAHTLSEQILPRGQPQGGPQDRVTALPPHLTKPHWPAWDFPGSFCFLLWRQSCKHQRKSAQGLSVISFIYDKKIHILKRFIMRREVCPKAES